MPLGVTSLPSPPPPFNGTFFQFQNTLKRAQNCFWIKNTCVCGRKKLNAKVMNHFHFFLSDKETMIGLGIDKNSISPASHYFAPPASTSSWKPSLSKRLRSFWWVLDFVWTPYQSDMVSALSLSLNLTTISYLTITLMIQVISLKTFTDNLRHHRC